MKLKPSNYNFCITLADGQHVMYNSLTGGLFEIEPENLENIQYILENCNDSTPEYAAIKENLTDNYLLIPEDVNELDLVRMKNMMRRFRSNEFSLTIMPTVDCNFACKYCYESRHAGFMGEHVKKGIIDWVEKIAEPGKNVVISWFGGEPLLDFPSVDEINRKVIQICEAKSAVFYSNMTTNGYLIQDEILSRVDQLQINAFQITLDGTAEYHNRYRPLRNGSPTFDTVFHNILRILDKTNANVRLRVNIDLENYQNIFALMDLFPEQYRSSRLEIYFRTIFTSPNEHLGNNSMIREKAIPKYDVQKSLYQYAFDHGFYPYFPVMFRKDYFCESCLNNHFVIHPSGNIYKCTIEFEEGKIIGRIGMDGIVQIDAPTHARWMSSVPGDREQCRTCRFLPICQGGCRYHQLLGKKTCPPEAMDIQSLVELLYLSTLYAKQVG